MKFEKLSENKIRITLTIQDLAEKEIDFHAFMSNSVQSQNIILDMLEEAKKETGFDPEDYNLRIEALAMADTDFVFTITKVIPEEKEKNKIPKKKFTIKRKTLNPTSTQAIYSFSTFDDYCSFLHYINENNLLKDTSNIADSIILYEYEEKYYLFINSIHNEADNKLKFYAGITEFGKFVTNSKVFASKLVEFGNLIMDNNALKIGVKHFINK